VSEGTRTPDRLDHNQELYQLSYAHRVGAECTCVRTGSPAPGSRRRGEVLRATSGVGAIDFYPARLLQWDVPETSKECTHSRARSAPLERYRTKWHHEPSI
jgi:hypothetical protein